MLSAGFPVVPCANQFPDAMAAEKGSAAMKAQ
jgi:hypothetical protein